MIICVLDYLSDSLFFRLIFCLFHVCLLYCYLMVYDYKRKSFSHGGINYVIVSFCADMMMSWLSVTLFVITIIAMMMITCVLILFLVSLNNGNVADIRLNLSCVSVDLSDCLHLLLA